MDLRQLRYFARVVESGSFSKAANQLHVAQPALSQHVRHMEDELGVTLLHRGSQGVAPTEAGQRLHRHAKRILAEFAEIPDSVRGEAIAPRGDVRFGLPGTVSEILAAAADRSGAGAISGRAHPRRRGDERIHSRVVEARRGRSRHDLQHVGPAGPRGASRAVGRDLPFCEPVARRAEQPRGQFDFVAARGAAAARRAGAAPWPARAHRECRLVGPRHHLPGGRDRFLQPDQEAGPARARLRDSAADGGAEGGRGRNLQDLAVRPARPLPGRSIWPIRRSARSSMRRAPSGSSPGRSCGSSFTTPSGRPSFRTKARAPSFTADRMPPSRWTIVPAYGPVVRQRPAIYPSLRNHI